MAYPVDSQFASDACGRFTTHAPTIGRNSAHERGCGGAMERARFNVLLLRLTTGPRQWWQAQRQCSGLQIRWWKKRSATWLGNTAWQNL